MRCKLLLCLLFSIMLGPKAALADEFSFIEWDVRSLPVLGFFPIGGNLSIDDAQLSTFMIGPSIDLLNINTAKTRLSFLNISGYLLGVNYSALTGQNENTQVIDVGFFRAGPHYRMSGLWGQRLALGSQIGYGVLLAGSTEERTSTFLHGIELSFSFSWTDYEPPTASGRVRFDSKTMGWLGALAILGGSATLFVMAGRSESTASQVWLGVGGLALLSLTPLFVIGFE